jgi:hypothetical protein
MQLDKPGVLASPNGMSGSPSLPSMIPPVKRSRDSQALLCVQ